MFAKPYSPNNKFNKHKILGNTSKQNQKIQYCQSNHCLRCQINSPILSKLRKKSLKLISSLEKQKININRQSSFLPIYFDKQTNEYNKKTRNSNFIFSKSLPKNINKHILKGQQDKRTKLNLSLQKFSNKFKSKEKISFKEIIYSSKNLNKKSSLGRKISKQFKRNNIYELYECLQNRYEKLEKKYNQITVLKNKKCIKTQSKKTKQSQQRFKQNNKIKINQKEPVQQNYQIKTKWSFQTKNKENKMKKQINSKTSIQTEQQLNSGPYQIKGNDKQQIQNHNKQRQAQFYRQQCLSLQKQLQSVYTTVLELKKQIQILNEGRSVKYEFLKNDNFKQPVSFTLNYNMNEIHTKQQGQKYDKRQLFILQKRKDYQLDQNTIGCIKADIEQKDNEQQKDNINVLQIETQKSINIQQSIIGQTSIILDRKSQIQMDISQQIQVKMSKCQYHEEQTGVISQLSENKQISTTCNIDREYYNNEQISHKDNNSNANNYQQSNYNSQISPSSYSHQYSSNIYPSYILKPTINYSNSLLLQNLQSSPIIYSNYQSASPLLSQSTYINTSTQLHSKYYSYCKKYCPLNQCKCLLEMINIK